MKILKYKKIKANEYKIITDKEEFNLYDDIIIKYELLLKKEISKKELENILKENNLLKVYYIALKALNIKMRSKKELESILKKKDFTKEEIEYTLEKLEQENYLNSNKYIEAYIHDIIMLKMVGEQKILNDLKALDFDEKEIKKHLEKVDKNIYLDKIQKYIDKKAKVNKKSINEFKRKTLNELLNNGFYKEDVLNYLENINIDEDKQVLEKLVLKLYKKYINKYDLYTTKNKIKAYLYNKGYTNVDIDSYIEKTSD